MDRSRPDEGALRQDSFFDVLPPAACKHFNLIVCVAQRFRKLLEREGVWSEELEKQAQKEAKKEILSAVKKADGKLRGPLVQLFEDTFDVMPDHLLEQHAQLEKHVREYPDEYELQKFRDATSPLPAAVANFTPMADRKLRPAPSPRKAPDGAETEEMNMCDAVKSALAVVRCCISMDRSESLSRSIFNHLVRARVCYMFIRLWKLVKKLLSSAKMLHLEVFSAALKVCEKNTAKIVYSMRQWQSRQ